jgi:hypothetical protein
MASLEGGTETPSYGLGLAACAVGAFCAYIPVPLRTNEAAMASEKRVFVIMSLPCINRMNTAFTA